MSRKMTDYRNRPTQDELDYLSRRRKEVTPDAERKGYTIAAAAFLLASLGLLNGEGVAVIGVCVVVFWAIREARRRRRKVATNRGA
jgi:hypothetical protein